LLGAGRDLFASDLPPGVAAEARRLHHACALSEREAWGMVHGIGTATLDTATAITLTVGLCIAHQIWGERFAEQQPAAAAIEEAIRLGTPFAQAYRYTRQPLTLPGGLTVDAGEPLLLWLTAANRGLPDPHLPASSTHPDMHSFVPDRQPNDHLGWGTGYHLCAGVHAARMVARTAVTALATHDPQLLIGGNWERHIGIDDGFTAAVVTTD
jgi:cytochrome P450